VEGVGGLEVRDARARCFNKEVGVCHFVEMRWALRLTSLRGVRMSS
jgi:hypothetical protein